jgi:large subunit ribosomal protein L24
MNIKKGDNVKILKGNDRGKSGKVIRVLPRVGQVVVESINLHQKAVRPKRAGEKGQLIKLPLPISVSNVMLICPTCGRASRVGYRKPEKGNKERYCKKCNATV